MLNEPGSSYWLRKCQSAWLPRADDVAGMLEEVGDTDIGVCYDVANAVYSGEDPDYGLRRVKDWLRLVHPSDTGVEEW